MLINFVDATNNANHYTKPPTIEYTFRPIKIDSVRYYIIHNMCCINFSS